MAYTIIYETQLSVTVGDDGEIIGYDLNNYGDINTTKITGEPLLPGDHGWDVPEHENLYIEETVDGVVEQLKVAVSNMTPEGEINAHVAMLSNSNPVRFKFETTKG